MHDDFNGPVVCVSFLYDNNNITLENSVNQMRRRLNGTIILRKSAYLLTLLIFSSVSHSVE